MSDIPRKTKGFVHLRDQGQCVRCGGEGELNFHHRMLRRHAPKAVVHNPENVIMLCGSGTTGCHGWVHANPAVSYKLGYMVRAWGDPLTTPCYYADAHFYLLDNESNRTIHEKAA